MSNISIFIVEDDAIIRATLKLLLVQNNFEIAGEADEAEDALTQIQALKPDMAILDINLKSENDGVWLAHQLRTNCNIPLVFITAYNDSVTLKRVFETKPNGFLSKPFKQADIFSAINIALQNFSDNTTPAQYNNQPSELPSAEIDFLYVKEKKLLIKVKFADILYLKSDGNYVEIHTPDRKFLLRSKLNELHSKLPVASFVQVHQRYVVDVNRITAMGTNFVMLDQQKIPVSKSYAHNLKS